MRGLARLLLFSFWYFFSSPLRAPRTSGLLRSRSCVNTESLHLRRVAAYRGSFHGAEWWKSERGREKEREYQNRRLRTFLSVESTLHERVLPSGLIEKNYYATRSLMIGLFRALIAIIFSFVRSFFFFPPLFFLSAARKNSEELGEYPRRVSALVLMKFTETGSSWSIDRDRLRCRRNFPN